MNTDSLTLRPDDSPKTDYCTALQYVRVHCQCTSSFLWPEPLPKNSCNLQVSSLFYHPAEVRVGQCRHYDFTVLWGGGQGKHVLDRNWKKRKNKNVKYPSEFGIGMRFHIQLCHLISLQAQGLL